MDEAVQTLGAVDSAAASGEKQWRSQKNKGIPQRADFEPAVLYASAPRYM